MKTWDIYTLSDPRTPEMIRYVGVAHRGLPARLAAHMNLARSGIRRHVYAWIRKLLREGIAPFMQSVQVGQGAEWAETERYWIRWHRERGFDLTNATDGGEGTLGHRHSVETRLRMSKSRTGLKISPETILKMAAGRVGKKQTAERIARRIIAVKSTWARKKADGWEAPHEWSTRTVAATAANTGKHRSPETKAKISLANSGRVMGPEARAKMSAAKKGKPPHNKGKPGPRPSAETRARLSEAQKRRWARQKEET